MLIIVNPGIKILPILFNKILPEILTFHKVIFKQFAKEESNEKLKKEAKCWIKLILKTVFKGNYYLLF